MKWAAWVNDGGNESGDQASQSGTAAQIESVDWINNPCRFKAIPCDTKLVIEDSHFH
jgi:hypothetical protein